MLILSCQSQQLQLTTCLILVTVQRKVESCELQLTELSREVEELKASAANEASASESAMNAAARAEENQVTCSIWLMRVIEVWMLCLVEGGQGDVAAAVCIVCGFAVSSILLLLLLLPSH